MRKVPLLGEGLLTMLQASPDLPQGSVQIHARIGKDGGRLRRSGRAANTGQEIAREGAPLGVSQPGHAHLQAPYAD